MNKKLSVASQVEGEDRLSSLSDDVIHRILSFLGTRLAVQTSILSRRWKHIWTALPVLTFDGYDQLFPYTHSGIIKFIDHVLSHRNHRFNISSFKFFALYPIPRSLINRIIEYPVSLNVQDLDFDLQFYRHYPFKLSTFSSGSIQKLRLGVHLDFGKLCESDGCWDLPVLTTLHLKCPIYMSNYIVPESCLVCLPALTTLSLDRCEFPKSVSVNLPALTTLTMASCELPRIWEFPALVTLELDDVLFPPNVGDLLSELVSLRNLTIMFSEKNFVKDLFLHCPELVNLKIITSMSICSTPAHRIEVVAMKLCRFYCVGLFLVTLYVKELENATLKLWDTNEFNNLTMPKKKVFYRRLDRMFWELGSAKILTIDSATFEALSMHCNLFKNVSSPFNNLECVKLPQGYKESSISTTLRKYLLGGSPGATIVTALPQVLVQDEKRVQVDHLVENSAVDAYRGRHVGAPVAGTGIDQGSSSIGNSDYLLWKDLEISSEFVGLLDLIMKKYPETFEYLALKDDRFYTKELNMLCTSVNEFLRTSMTEFSTDVITEYRDLFADLHARGFRIYWLASHLTYIEQLRFSQYGLQAVDSRTEDSKTKLQDVQSYCLEKIMKI